MLYTLVVILPALAWRIQAQNGTSPANIDSDMTFATMDQGEFGSSENESEYLTTASSSEFESTSSDQFTTTHGGFQVNEVSVSITVASPQVTTLLNDGSSEAGQTSFTELDVNGLSDVSNENTFTEVPNRSPESETDSEQDDSDEMESPGQTINPFLGSTSERSDEGSSRNSGKKDNPSGERMEFRGKRETASNIGPSDSFRETNFQEGKQVTGMISQPGTTWPSVPEGVNNETAVVQAFSVGLFGQFQFPSNGTPVQFQTIFFNEGQLYNTSSGKFIAEISGIYSFTYSAIFSVKPMKVVLIVNGNPIINNFDGQWKGNINQASASLILRLRSGDEIWFKFVNNDQKKKYSIMFTFSGFLLSL